MGKTLMDGKSKTEHPSQSESFDSFRGTSLVRMQNRKKISESYPLQPTKNTCQSPDQGSLGEDEEEDTSQQSDSRFEKNNQRIIPSAPPRINTPDVPLDQVKDFSNPSMLRPDRPVSLKSPEYAPKPGLQKKPDTSFLPPDDSRIPSSPSNKMTSFENDAEGFIGGLEVSQKTDWMTSVLTVLSMVIVVMTFPFSMFFCLKIVAEYERAVVLRMGRLLPDGKGTKGPGLFFILPCIDNIRTVELRTVTFSIPPQEVLTRDSVTVAVDAVVYYRICNPAVSILNVEDAARSTRLLAQTTLRNVLGTKDLAQILMDREEMSVTMQSTLDGATEAWGVKVERVEIKDVRLPVALQRAMAAEAEATREARAKVIAANGEHKASRALKEAALVIASSPLALQLRYLQTLNAISAEKNSTIIFPLPIDILGTGSGFSMHGSLTNGKNAIVKRWLPSIQDYPESDGMSPEHRGPPQKTASHHAKPVSAIAQAPVTTSAAENRECEVFTPDEDFDTYSDSV